MASQVRGDGGGARPARYGAYVFGDRIPMNLTIDWEEVRDKPALFGKALEFVGEVLPGDGGELDLKVSKASERVPCVFLLPSVGSFVL